MFDHQFIESLLENIGGSAVTIVLDSAGRCKFASKTIEGILNLSPNEILDQRFLDKLKFYTLDNHLVDDKKNPITRCLKDSTFIQATPFFCKLDPSSDTILALTTIRITSANKKDYILVQVRQAKREVEVGEMKSLFVSFAAHQLKTPSSIVKGFLELMMRQGEASYSKEQWHFLTSAFESNEQLIAVSKSLLNLARLEGGLIEPGLHEFDPNRAIQKKIASFSPLYKTKRVNVNLSVSVDENATMLRSDESFFLEVFGILLGNAIKHSPVGESITVSCKLSPQQYEVHVLDNGPGIPEAVRAGLFNAQQDPSEQENSHGLGLYLAKKYIALLNGSIGIEEAEQGSDFYFILPNS